MQLTASESMINNSPLMINSCDPYRDGEGAVGPVVIAWLTRVVIDCSS